MVYGKDYTVHLTAFLYGMTFNLCLKTEATSQVVAHAPTTTVHPAIHDLPASEKVFS